MNGIHELIFGYGTTRCLGSPIAMMELNNKWVSEKSFVVFPHGDGIFPINTSAAYYSNYALYMSYIA